MERGHEDNFSRLGTLGIEEEFYVVDEQGHPTSGTDELVYETDAPEILAGRIDHELFKFVIEAQTPLIEARADARDTLLQVRRALITHAREHGYRIATAGLHPTAMWRDLEHAEKPRYRSQLDRIQYPQHRNTTAGLHVHVGVDDADKAVWVANEIRWYLPLILALSENSPFWCGFDTGLHSARAKIFEALPNTGIPTAFDSYEEFDTFEKEMLRTDAIDDRGELWYDVRPHSEHGTVEVRTPDAQGDPDRVMAFVEYIHELVLDLCTRYEDGESGTDHRHELLEENKWRAIRYGQEGSLIGRDWGDPRSIADLVYREADRLDVPALADLYESESGTDHQRRVRREAGDDALRSALMLSTEDHDS